MKYPRGVNGNTIHHKIRNGTIRETLAQKNVGHHIETTQLRLFGHICRVDEGKRRRDRPAMKWMKHSNDKNIKKKTVGRGKIDGKEQRALAKICTKYTIKAVISIPKGKRGNDHICNM